MGRHTGREKVREREGKCMWPGVPVLIVGIIIIAVGHS